MSSAESNEGAMPACRVIRAADTNQTYTGRQGLTYFAGVCAQNTGARGLCLHLLTILPGGRAKAHLHEGHESAIYVLSGESEMWFGEGLSEHVIVGTGDFLYIPAGVPHLPANRSQTVSCTAVIARTDPDEQESVVLLPELEPLAY